MQAGIFLQEIGMTTFYKYFEIAYNENNHLRITELGRNILFGKEKATLVIIKREEFVAKSRKKKAVKEIKPEKPDYSNEDEFIFEELRVLRKKLADEQAIPAYIVLSDKVLHLLSSSRPTTIEEFGNISGIGEFKKEKYGKDFVGLIKKLTKESK